MEFLGKTDVDLIVGGWASQIRKWSGTLHVNVFLLQCPWSTFLVEFFRPNAKNFSRNENRNLPLQQVVSDQLLRFCQWYSNKVILGGFYVLVSTNGFVSLHPCHVREVHGMEHESMKRCLNVWFWVWIWPVCWAFNKCKVKITMLLLFSPALNSDCCTERFDLQTYK